MTRNVERATATCLRDGGQLLRLAPRRSRVSGSQRWVAAFVVRFLIILIAGLVAVGCGGSAASEHESDAGGLDGGKPDAAGGENCDALAAAYSAALVHAKSCTTDLDPQCTKLVDDNLACPCPTFVWQFSPEVKTLASLEQQWQTGGCAKPCPNDSCIVPQSANCVPGDPSGDFGGCEDK